MWLKQRIRARSGIDTWIQAVIVFPHAFVHEWQPVRDILIRNGKYLVDAIEKSRTDPAAASRLWELHEQGRDLW